MMQLLVDHPCEMTQANAPYPMPFTRVELCTLAVVNEGFCVLLGRREQAPFKGRWALPGGVLRIDIDASLEDAAQRVAKERLGLQLPYLRQQCTVGGPGRDPRALWSLSVVYRALAPMEDLAPKAGKRLEALRWATVEQAMTDTSLAFDHESIISNAVTELRAEVSRLDLPFNFLPPEFTLGELQAACEVLLGRKLDKSSFRRRLDDRQSLQVVAGAFKRGASRPAQLYRARDGAARS